MKMATPVPPTATAFLHFLDIEDEMQRIEVEALSIEDPVSTMEYLLQETQHAYQIIDQRQNEVKALQAELTQLKAVGISVPVQAQLPANLTENRTIEGKKLSAVVEKFVTMKQQIENRMSQDDDDDQFDADTLLEDIEELEAAHADYESGIKKIVSVLENAQTESSKKAASLSSQIKATNERSTTAEKAAGDTAVAAVQSAGIMSIENARLRAEVDALKSGNSNDDSSEVRSGHSRKTHGISDQKLKELLNFANRYTSTVPLLEHLGQLINSSGQVQHGSSNGAQCCSACGICCRDCEIDFKEYIRLFDESIENASCLQDRIATLESLIRDGSNIPPARLDNFIQLTEEINKLQRQLDEANSELSYLSAVREASATSHQSGVGGNSTDFTRLLSRISELEAENTALGEELEEAVNKISDMEIGKDMADNEEVGDLHDEIDSLRDQIASLRRGSREEIIQQLDKELADCQKQREKATTEYVLVQHSHQHLQGDYDAAQAEVARLQEIIKGLRRESGASIDIDEFARLTAALAECQRQRSKDAIEIAQLDELLLESTDKQQDLQPESDDASLDASYANAEVTRLNKKLTEALSNIVNAKRENLAIQERLNDCEANRSGPGSIDIDIAAISARANKVQGLEDRLKEAEKTIALLQARIAGDRNAGHQAEVDQLNERITEFSEFLDEREQELAELQAEHAEQTASFEILALAKADVEAQRDRAEADLEQEIQDGGDSIAEMEAKINDLQEKLDQYNAASNKPPADTGSARLKKRIKDITAERDDLLEELNSVGQDPEQITTVKWLRGKKADLKEELENAKSQLKERDAATIKAQAAAKRLQTALDKAEETVEGIRGERTQARKQRDDARKRLEACETGGGSPADLEALRAELEKYKSAASVSERALGASEIAREKLQNERDKAIAERDAARRERDEGRDGSPTATQKLMIRIVELEKNLEQSTDSQQEAEDQFAEEKSILRNKIRDLELSLANTQKLLDASRQTSRDAEDESIRQLEQLKLQLQDERDSTQRLQDEFTKAQADGEVSESDRNAALVRHLSLARSRLLAREQLINDMNTRLSSAAASKNVEAAELRRQLAVAQAEIFRLNVDPTPDQEELTRLREENSELHGKLQDVKDARRRLWNEQAETERLRNSNRDLLLKIKEGRCCEKAREGSGWEVAGNAADEYIESERESRLETIASLEDYLKESNRVIANLSITLERNTRDSERQTSENLTNLTTARAQLASLTTQLENISPETDAHLWQKINDCNRELDAKEKLIQEQRDDVADLQLKVENAQTEISALRDEISYLEKANADLENQLSNSFRGKKRRASQSSFTAITETEKDEEIQELKEKLARKEAELKSKKRATREPRPRFADDGDDDELEETMMENERLRNRREKERKALVTQNRKLREQLKLAETKYAEMYGFVDEDLQNEPDLGNDAAQRRLIATIKEHNKRLQKELDGWKNNDILKDSQQQITKLEREIEELHYKLVAPGGAKDAVSGQTKSSQMSTEERNGYIIDIETWQQRVRELEEEVEELKEEVASLQEENTRLAEDLKTKRDFLDKVLNTVDNFKEEVQAIEEEEVDPDQPYDNASEASTEIITQGPGGSRDASTPAAERRQWRDFGRRMTPSSIRKPSRQCELLLKADPQYVSS